MRSLWNVGPYQSTKIFSRDRCSADVWKQLCLGDGGTVLLIDRKFHPVVMAARGDLFGSQGSISMDRSFQLLIVAVETVSVRRLCRIKMKKKFRERFSVICDELLKGFSSPSERGRCQLTRTALNEEQRPGRYCFRASSTVALDSYQGSPRKHFVRAKEPPLASTIAVLKNRQQQGMRIDSFTFIDVLKRCSEQKDLIAARQVHECIIQSRMDQNPFVVNSLLNVYVKCGKLHDAMTVFNVMLQGDGKAHKLTCLTILKACRSPKALKWGQEVHAYIRRTGLESDVRVGTALVQMYAKCGCITEARRIFENLTNRNLITWNVMIRAYAESGFGVEAYRLFLQVKQEGFIPDAFTYTSILNASSSAGALKWVKNVHSHVLEAGLESDLRVGNALVHMYAKSGSLDDARLVFDRMKKRDVITWNVMIGAYAESGCGVEAYGLFLQMKREGFIPDAFTCLSILNASASEGALDWVREVHSHALKTGLEADLRVGNALVHMYAKSGSLDDARLVFDRIEKRDIITWTAMIGAYAECGCGVEAYGLFVKMQREGFIPGAITCLSILNPSASAGALPWVKEVHSHVLKTGLESDLRVGNALVHMYAKSGNVDDARLVFDRMKKRDVITWTVMIGAYAGSGCGVEAYGLFVDMKREGFIPDAITCLSILNASASEGALDWVREVHSHVLEAGLESDLRVGNALVHMYAKSGSIDDAQLVFDRMEKRDVITWNLLIGAYAGSGCGLEAYGLFLQMKREGLKPDAFTYVSILNVSASAGALEWVKEVHSHAFKTGLESDLRVGSALVHMYAKSGSIDDARLVFDRMEKRDVILWTAMIGAYAEIGCGVQAYELFLEMKREGFIPDAFTYVSILNASASEGALEWVKEVHIHALKAGLESDLRVGSALVHMYAKSGSIDDARLVFDRMDKRDVMTWTAMIGAYAESGCGVEAYGLFLQMKREGFIPDAFTYVSILNAAASTGALEWVKEVHSNALEAGLESDLRVGIALMHMYTKSGSIDDARLVFGRMKKRDVVAWNTMIGGLAQHGCGHEALELLREMNTTCVKSDGRTFGAVLSACSHGGLVNDGRKLFAAMMQDYGIEPTVVHYSCMVDLLGRAGQLDEAKLFIADMPVEPNAVTWGAFLGACRIYGNLELAELAGKELLKVGPENASAYVLLSNIFAAAGKWEKVSMVRTMMQERGVQKEPGRSWIEVDNKIHDFVVGDTSHPEAKTIHTELNELTKKLKAEGYIPDTQLVLQNIREEDKELALCSHSEKLAIAYGLLRIPRGKPIRVYKNLRVCSDCHTATKFISKVTGREIIARDANRFHQFKDGVCSCGDYW